MVLLPWSRPGPGGGGGASGGVAGRGGGVRAPFRGGVLEGGAIERFRAGKPRGMASDRAKGCATAAGWPQFPPPGRGSAASILWIDRDG